MNSQLAPGSHRVVLLDVQKTFRRLPPFSGSVISLCPMSPLLLEKWETEENRRVDTKPQTGWSRVHTTIGAFRVTALRRRRKTWEVQGQSQIHGGHLGYMSASSQVTERRNKKTRERKKKGRMKEEMRKAKWKVRTEEKDVVSLILTSSPRETSRSPHPFAALHIANSFSVQFTLGLS